MRYGNEEYKMRRTAVAGLIMLFCISAATSAEMPEIAQDSVVRKGNPLNNVKVVKDTWMEVVAKRGPIESRIAANEVTQVRYATTPDTYYKGLAEGEAGNYVKALQYLIWTEQKRLDENTASMKQGLYFHIARFYVKHRGEGDMEKARTYLEKLFTEVPDSRFLPDALLLYARTYFLEGNSFDKALKAYEDAERKLDSMANKIMNRGHEMYLRRRNYMAKYWQAECLMMLERYSEAKGDFQSLASVASTNDEYKRIELMAKLGEARAVWQQERPDEAFENFSALVEEAEAAGVRDILAGAYSGLGDCYYQKGQYHAALWNYLKVAVQYFDASEYVPKAAYRAGMCYLEIARAEDDAEAGKMARHYFEKAAASGDGFWAQEAGKRLKSL